MRVQEYICFFLLLASLIYRASTLEALQNDETTYSKHAFRDPRSGHSWTYNEGTRPTPSTGPSIDLIAANARQMNRRNSAGSCQTLTAGFYLPPGTRPFLTIQEKEPHLFYVVDSVEQQGGWREGQVNMFSWGAGAVIDKLNHQDDNTQLTIDKLGALVQLEDSQYPSQSSHPSALEVVPVSLSCGWPPEISDSYEFVFRASQPMSASVIVHQARGRTTVYEDHAVQLKSPFSTSIPIRAVNWPEGWYSIELRVAAAPTIEKTVRFYHRASLKN